MNLFKKNQSHSYRVHHVVKRFASMLAAPRVCVRSLRKSPVHRPSMRCTHTATHIRPSSTTAHSRRCTQPEPQRTAPNTRNRPPLARPQPAVPSRRAHRVWLRAVLRASLRRSAQPKRWPAQRRTERMRTIYGIQKREKKNHQWFERVDRNVWHRNHTTICDTYQLEHDEYWLVFFVFVVLWASSWLA